MSYESRKFINTLMASKEIGLKPRTIQNYIKAGYLPAKKLGRLYLIDKKVWEEWKARNIVAC